MTSRFVIGIDLGTTNCVVAYAELESPDAPKIELLQIPQLVTAGTVESFSNLPSFLYLASEREQVAAGVLPWSSGSGDQIVGRSARTQAAETPERTVSAAKSWLGHSGVDRHAAILPWEAPQEVPRISPVCATQRYLEHLVCSWNTAHPDAPFTDQKIVITVPASFDASARELTREAAVGAGVPANFVLLEEPQAAVYAWLTDEGESWRDRIQVGDQLLVCDVGGGTTDLTLIRASEVDGALQLDRLAVGKHLLVGGDNMDLALAHHAVEAFAEQNVKLDAWQSVSLWHACRHAKESLLADDGPESQKVSILGRGRKLIGGTVSTDLDREAVTRLLVDGFFPRCELEDRPQMRHQSGFVQIGLPFESDTAITRHIANFLGNYDQSESTSIQPTHLLFNGGVFRSGALRKRMTDVLSAWYVDRPPAELHGTRDLDHAVARGAAYYGWTKECGGVRIRGGTARSYYMGVETAGLAIPGAPRPLKAICVVPFGMEEGTQVDVPGSEIGLVLGQPVQFRFFSSLVRREDQVGAVLDSVDENQLEETDSLEASLPPSSTGNESYVPVRFQSRVTELGVFELWCVSTQSEDRWKLEFSVRPE